MFEGIPVDKVTMLPRFGTSSGDTVSVPAGQAVLVGGFYTTANGQIDDTILKRMLSSVHAPADRPVMKGDATDSRTCNTSAYQQFRNTATNQVEWFQIGGGRKVSLDCLGMVVNSTGTLRLVAVGVGIDSTVTNSAQIKQFRLVTNVGGAQMIEASCQGMPGVGRHVGVPLEYGGGADTQTWYGDAGTLIAQSGIIGSVLN
jgi:hypothetical protein